MLSRILAKVVVGVIAAASLPAAAHAVTIVPNFVNGAGTTWTDVRRQVILQAISDWQAIVLDNHAINVTFDFTHAGTSSYFGFWQGAYSNMPNGTNLCPWTSGVTQTVHFNVDRFSGANYTWWDSTPTTSDDLPQADWDALTVARHELGHMLGFTAGFYLSSSGTPQSDKWAAHITGSTFDPGGLNVSMASSSDLTHVLDGGATAGDLMVPAIANGVRYGISATDISMLHLAYGYVDPAIWRKPGGGSYNLPANWTINSVPIGVNATANFAGDIKAPSTVTLDSAITVGTINFNSVQPYTIAGPALATIQVSSGNANISVQTGNHVISAPLRLASNTNINTAAGGTVDFRDGISNTPVCGVTKTGDGTAIFRAANTYSGGTSVLGGTLQFASAGALPAGTNLTVGGSGVVLFSSGFTGPITSAGSEPVAEPSTLALFGVGAVGLLGFAWRRRRLV
jgi:autotransporter-associated beta strand protein